MNKGLRRGIGLSSLFPSLSQAADGSTLTRLQSAEGGDVWTPAPTGFINYIETGCIWTADSAGSTLNASMTSGYCRIAGVRLFVPAIIAYPFTASKDTYVDFQSNGSQTAQVFFTTATNNAASPALANNGTTTNTIRNAIIVSGANIASSGSINQGQPAAVLPISTEGYAVSDTLGNLINPQTPNPNLIAYRAYSAGNVTTSSTSPTVNNVTLTCPAIVPTGRFVKVTWGALYLGNNTAGDGSNFNCWDTTAGAIGSGATQIGRYESVLPAADLTTPLGVTYNVSVGTGALKTFGVNLWAGVGGTVTLSTSAGAPLFVAVELV